MSARPSLPNYKDLEESCKRFGRRGLDEEWWGEERWREEWVCVRYDESCCGMWGGTVRCCEDWGGTVVRYEVWVAGVSGVLYQAECYSDLHQSSQRVICWIRQLTKLQTTTTNAMCAWNFQEIALQLSFQRCAASYLWLWGSLKIWCCSLFSPWWRLLFSIFIVVPIIIVVAIISVVDLAFVWEGMRAHASLFSFRHQLVLMNCKNPPRRPFQTFQPLLWSIRNIGTSKSNALRAPTLNTEN